VTGRMANIFLFQAVPFAQHGTLTRLWAIV